jgi:hypothetical protein
MEFFIKKNATLPLLKLQVVRDGRSDFHNFMKTIELSSIFFSMVDVENGVSKISSRPAGFVEKTQLDPNSEPEYYIYYQFQNRDTNKVGRYEGQFMLRNDDGVLILPIREKLFINVQESFIADDLPYESCYVSEFPCCVNPLNPTPIAPSSTPTSTPTQTPTPTQTGVTVSILTEVMSGSVIFNFSVLLSRQLNTDYTITLTKQFNVVSGSPINVSVSVTIPINEISGSTSVVIDDDVNRIAVGSTTLSIDHNPNNGIVYNSIEDIKYINFIPNPNPTITPTPTPTPTPQINETFVVFGKSTKQRIYDTDITNFTKKNVNDVQNQYLEYPSQQGYCYLLVPSYMNQPSVFRDSADGCDGFVIPFLRVEDIEFIDSNGNLSIYYVYRSFVSTSSKVDVWVCD